ncbi:MAG TPA: heavy metal-binding domain-containing protein [Parasphingorhabdus sp.]
MIGARQGTMTMLQRLVAAAMSRDIRGFVVPGADVARAAGLDLGGAGLHLSATPRHANVLVIIAPLPAGLADAASVAYGQMPRPRAILALGSGDLGPLPDADATGPLTQAGLVTAMEDLRWVIATGSFRSDVDDYEAPTLQTRTEYTCPMHPEVVQDEPGNCPKCGMTLVLRKAAVSSHAGHAMPEKERDMPVETRVETTSAGHDHANDKGNKHGGAHDHGHAKHAVSEPLVQYTCPMHSEVISAEPGSCPKCGMFLVPADTKSEHAGHDARHGHTKHAADESPARYTCPMHPEVVQDEPGNCPKCGMTLVPVEEAVENSGHDHGAASQGHDNGSKSSHQGSHASHGNDVVIEGIEAHFMSMTDLTRDMPASEDGLKMEWIGVPFGPFFPGLPSGLRLDLTLDGDAVAGTSADSAVGLSELLHEDTTTPAAFVDQLAALSPLSPVAYSLLACLALEQAAEQSVPSSVARARIAAAERERLTSHFGWLAGFGTQAGFTWLEKRATALQLKLRVAPVIEIAALAPKITALLTRIQRTPLLKARLKGIGRLAGDDALPGPVARAGGIARDARSDDPIYTELGFTVLTATDGDALARLTQRCGEIFQSLELILKVGAIAMPEPHGIGTASGTGEAVVETPRGAARLSLTLHNGKVTAANIETPTAAHVDLIATVADGRELGDALTGIGSLDMSPWEVTA